MAKKPHVLPDRTPGEWTGTCEVRGADQERKGEVEVRIEHRPIDLVRAEQTWTLTGEVEQQFSYIRTRIGNRHTYDGPDLFGNAMGYGRALYTTQHHCTEPFKVKGREFFIDADFTMAAAWKLYDGDRMTDLVHGPLTWNPSS